MFWTQNFFRLKIFSGPGLFYRPTNFWAPNFFFLTQNFFRLESFLDPKFWDLKFFQTQNLFGPKIFSDSKLFAPENVFPLLDSLALVKPT